MADARPPPATGTPSASPPTGPDLLDADALRNLRRLLDEGEIDADEFERRKEALGLEETNESLGALSRLPEDALRTVLSFLVVKPNDLATGVDSLTVSIDRAGRYVMQLVDEKVANGNDDYDLPKMLDRSRSLQAEALAFVGQTKSWVVLLFVCREFHRLFISLTPPEDYLHPFDQRGDRMEFNLWQRDYNQLLHVLKVKCPLTLIDEYIDEFDSTILACRAVSTLICKMLSEEEIREEDVDSLNGAYYYEGEDADY